ncbi:uncharacterized protein SCHCODRAFT_02490932 [Schizophyllum commune H4-8]|uniref:uncharacterized protein n=1 Tax=Schizophyllum commune (strain H4-8 / FGSC 9210) TaxID=578458 RepID=UPI00215E29E3|nr:uncharacterized protein SCHCODRAFT_02490932 [Schizophyllum commune H4-8]KAI5896015.1 hypothetical protein SCHCODRAFT_02490932 [Schizophyllum commune H4-8]
MEDRRVKLPATRTRKIPSEEYHVQKIVGHKWLRKGTLLKLKVRWVGYGWEHDTWQTEQDLRNAPERVAEYKLEHGL